MNKTLLKVCVGGFVGIVAGLIVGKRKEKALEAERDALLKDQKHMRMANADLVRHNDNLAEVNAWMKDCIVQLTENEEDEET